MKTAVDQGMSVSFRTDLGVLFLRWSSSGASVDFRSGYLQALEEAEHLQVRFVLFDIRSRGPATYEDILWLFSTFYPLWDQKLGSPSSLAYLISPSYFAYAKEHVGLDKIEQSFKNPELKLFTSEKEALHWLAERQRPAA